MPNKNQLRRPKKLSNHQLPTQSYSTKRTERDRKLEQFSDFKWFVDKREIVSKDTKSIVPERIHTKTRPELALPLFTTPEQTISENCSTFCFFLHIQTCKSAIRPPHTHPPSSSTPNFCFIFCRFLNLANTFFDIFSSQAHLSQTCKTDGCLFAELEFENLENLRD